MPCVGRGAAHGDPAIPVLTPPAGGHLVSRTDPSPREPRRALRPGAGFSLSGGRPGFGAGLGLGYGGCGGARSCHLAAAVLPPVVPAVATCGLLWGPENCPAKRLPVAGAGVLGARGAHATGPCSVARGALTVAALHLVPRNTAVHAVQCMACH